ncbi:probable serine/threonine-protein kinase PBL11 [Rhodamnia argentea]|uniref:non-specific serine/threonine protein kinase n=1 Tax=Rhodamnia argentea TaxID=178133 RepID=A0A8B8NNE5_9MYRT|nr:probable serine/threonine-protein kinase PBL11 [Rhodamnia argentea]
MGGSPGSSPTPMRAQDKPGLSHWTNVLGVMIIAMSVLLTGVTFYFFFRRKLLPAITRRCRRWTTSKAGSNLEDEKILLRRFQLEELVRATNNFSKECLVGSGTFGNVYRGTFHDEGMLAIKKPHADSYQSVEEFRNEVRLLSKVRHRNLVSLVGFCEEPGAREAKMLVYEYVPNGSLLEYIMGRRGRVLTWRQRVNLAIGAAKGIAHLHEEVKPSIIHRDLKPSNILIGEGFEAKVSDFGLVKSGPIEDQSHVSSQIKGTPGYLDPAYCSSFHLTPFSDVYSFGVILLQLVAARPAVDTGRNNSRYHIIEWARPSLERGDVTGILDANLLSQPCNMEVMLKMGQLALRCVVKSPKQRPTMTQVWQELEEGLRVTDSNSLKPTARSGPRRSMDRETSQSFSIDGVGYQIFHVEMDSLSFQSTSLRCLDADNLSIDFDKCSLRGIEEEK